MGELHLLVIDDDEQIRQVYRRALMRDFEVECRDDVGSALAIIDERARSGRSGFDVVLCDLHLARGSAADLWDELRRRSDDLQHRLVVVTGALAPHGDRLATTLGDRYVSKTASLADLRATLLRVAASRSSASTS